MTSGNAPAADGKCHHPVPGRPAPTGPGAPPGRPVPAPGFTSAPPRYCASASAARIGPR
jgi:hypothetical protein